MALIHIRLSELLEKIGNNIPGVLKSPKCEATFDGFGDSSLNFQLRIWSNTEIIYRIKSQVAIAIYDAFAEEGIEIPFPQRDLHVKSIDSIIKIDNPANSTNNNQEDLSENEQIK